MSDGQPSLGAELRAMAREAVKDIRQTMNEVVFNHHEHAPEPGTPLNPTQMEVTKEREVTHEQMLDSYADRVAAQEQDRGMGMER